MEDPAEGPQERRAAKLSYVGNNVRPKGVQLFNLILGTNMKRCIRALTLTGRETKKILLSVLGVAGLFAATSSIAGEGYIGASAGIMNVEDDSAGTGFSDTPLSAKVFGGYEVNENFALEVAYFSTLGDAEDDVFGVPVDISLDGFTVRFMGMIPTSDNFSIIGSVGYWDGEAEASLLGVSATAGEDGVTLGVGGKYRFETVSIRGEFEWFDSEDTIWTFLVGVQVNFGAN